MLGSESSSGGYMKTYGVSVCICPAKMFLDCTIWY